MTFILIAGIAAVFAGLFLSLTAVGVFTNEARGVSRSLAVVEAFTTAPRALQEDLDPSFRQRVVEPALDRFAAAGRKLTPSDYADRIRKKLDLAGNPEGWTIDRVSSLKFVGLVSGLLGSVGLSLLLGLGSLTMVGVCVLGAIVGYSGPNLYLYQKVYERTELLKRALPDALDLLSISVEAGLGFDAALQHVAKSTDGPLSEELARVLQEMQIGLGRAEALRALGERTNVPDMRAFVGAMVQAEAFGIPIGQVLRVQSSEIRIKRRQRAEEMAQKVPVKILVPLIFCILPALFIAVMGPAALVFMDAWSGQ